MNQLSLGITIALRDAFSARARRISRGFSSLDDTAYRAARGISRSAAIIEEQIYNITRSLAASVALLSAVVWPTKKAAEFSEGIARIATIADYANTNLKKVADTLIEQSFRFPTTPLQQAETAYRAISSGFIDTASALKVVEAATETAVTTLTTSDKALRAITGILNAYSLTADHAEIVADRLFETVRYGRILMDELGKYVGYGASAAAIGGINMEDFLSAVAVMTLGSLSPEQSFQYLRQLIIGTLKPTAQALRIGEKYGIKFGKEAIAQFGGDWTGWLMNAYDIIVGQGGSIEDFARLLSGRQAFAGAATLINLRKKLAEVKRGMANRYVLDDFGVLMSSRERALGIQSRELTYQLTRLTSGWEAVFTVMGQGAASVIRPVVSGLADITGYVLKAVQTFPLLSEAIMGVTAAFSAGTLVFGVYQIAQLKSSKAIMDMAKAAAATELPIWGMTLNLKNFVKVAAGSFLLLGGLVKLLKYAYERSKLLGESFDVHGNKINEGSTAWFNLYGRIQKFRTLARAVIIYFQNLEGTVGHIPLALANQLRAMGLWESYRRIVMIGGRLISFFKGVWVGLAETFKGMGRSIRNALFEVADFIERTFGARGIAERIRSFATDFLTMLQFSGIDKWQDIGIAVGKVVAMLGTLVMATKLWRSAVLLTVGAWKTALLPLKLIRTLLWTGPKAIMNGLISPVVGGARRVGRGARRGSLHLQLGWLYFAETVKDGFTSLDRWLVRMHRRLYERALAIPGAFHRMTEGVAGAFARMGARLRAARGFNLMTWLAGTQEWTRYNRRTGMFEKGYWGRGRHRGVFMRQRVVTPAEAGFLSRLYAIHAPNAWERVKGGARGMRAGMGRMAAGARAGMGRMVAGARALPGRALQATTQAASRAGLAFSSVLAAGAVKALGAFKALTAFMLGPWGLAIAAVVAGIILIVKNWDAVKAGIVATGKFIWDVLKFIAEIYVWVGQQVWNILPEPARDWLVTQFTRIKDVASTVWEAFKSGIDKVKPAFSWVVDMAKKLFNFFAGTDFKETFKVPEYLLNIDYGRVDSERLRALQAEQEKLLNRYVENYQATLIHGVGGKGAFKTTEQFEQYRALQKEYDKLSKILQKQVEASAGLGPGGIPIVDGLLPDWWPDGLGDAVRTGAFEGIRDGLQEAGINNILAAPELLRAWQEKIADPYAAYRETFRQELARNYQSEIAPPRRESSVADEVVKAAREMKDVLKRGMEAARNPAPQPQSAVIMLDGEVLGRFTTEYGQRMSRTEIDRSYTRAVG